jgi:hypothetical protein
LYPWHHLRVYPYSSVTVLMRDYNSRRSYKFDIYQLINDKVRNRKNAQHPLVNRVIPDNKPFRQLRESQDLHILFVSRHHDPDPTTSNIAEPDMESSKIISYIPHLGSQQTRTTQVGKKDTPITKNIPKGFFGYSISGKNSGARRKERATFVGW